VQSVNPRGRGVTKSSDKCGPCRLAPWIVQPGCPLPPAQQGATPPGGPTTTPFPHTVTGASVLTKAAWSWGTAKGLSFLDI
jgi:hypothetical protein